jgi:hypothetical protein
MSHVRQRGSRSARTRVACALAVGTASLLAAALPASAQEGSYVPDPQTTNIPYTAWAGTQLRLVKCSDALEGTKREGVFAEVESWSGDQNLRPQVIDQSIAFFRDDDGYGEDPGTRCVRFNVVSLGEGLARIKLKTFVKPDQTEILEHQFIAIWMRLGTPAIDEVGSADPTGGPAGSETEVGDPLGDGSFVPSSNNGRVQVTVSGSFPFRGSTVTLPSGWPALAAALATDVDPTNENPAMRWDIHDDTLKTEGHVNGACGPSVLTIDAVDNCRGGGDRGPFSRVFGDLSFPVVGPFDPLRINTLLSDGKLDAGDAPMPAARVDVKIAPNSGMSGDISGAGALEKADKTEVYSRDGNGTDSAHNLYAPFYKQWLPATAADDPAASGTDWFLSNNFPGAPSVKYDNWDTFPLTTVIGTDTGCNRTVGFEDEEGDEPRQTPSGDQRVAVFTDEHGEAQVEFEPYAGGFYYDSVVGAVHNDNRGCDLQDVRTLGTASITAQAKYVGQPNDFPEPVSAPLVKTIGNEFDKSLAYYPKGAGTANANARILVAHGQDVDGSPFAGERVCFYVDDEADSYRLFSGMTGPADERFRVSTEQADTPSGLDPDVRCAYLDQYGNAALEVFNSDPQSINVIAEYIDEGLLRDRDLEFGTPGSGDPDPPPNTPPNNGGGGGNNGGTTPPTIRTIIKVVGPDAGRLLGGAKGASGNKKGARIASARIVRTKKGRYLVVKIVSTSKKATIKVRMKMRSGKARRVTRKVRTNRNVRVMRLSKAVKSVKVSLAK